MSGVDKYNEQITILSNLKESVISSLKEKVEQGITKLKEPVQAYNTKAGYVKVLQIYADGVIVDRALANKCSYSHISVEKLLEILEQLID